MGSPSTAQAFYGRTDRTALLELHGAIRYSVARALRGVIDDVIAHAEADQVVLDLRQVNFMDSTGLGVIARIGRRTLERRGRRAVIVCPDNDVARSLRSAALDILFALVPDLPFTEPPALAEVGLESTPSANAEATLGRIVLDAHRDLGALSEKNRDEYRDVIAALEADLHRISGEDHAPDDPTAGDEPAR
jgi:anti-anti-sigma factor